MSREMLTADRTYYVRNDGNDTNDGLTDSSTGAFLTIQHAFDTVQNTLDLAGHYITIQCADGTYAPGYILFPWTGGGNWSVTLIGNETTPSNCLISGTNQNCVDITGGATVYVTGFKVTTTGTPGFGLAASVGSSLFYGTMEFGACSNSHVISVYNSFVYGYTDYTISGGAPEHLQSVDSSSIIIDNGPNITLVGTPNFSNTFAFCGNGSVIDMPGTTHSGSATGSRYWIQYNSSIITTVSPPTIAPPGSIAGTAKTNTGGYIL